MVKCTKDEYWHSKWAIGRFSSQKLEKLLSAHVNWMLATGLLAGRFVSYLDFLHIASCSRVLGSLTDTGMAVSHFCQTRGKSKPAVAARQLALWKDFSCTDSGLLSHISVTWNKFFPPYFFSFSVECMDACLCMWMSGCVSGSMCVHSHLLTVCVRFTWLADFCVSSLHQFSTNEAGDSVGLSDWTECQQAYSLPPGSAWQHGGKDTGERNKGRREEGTMDGRRKGSMLPVKDAENRVWPVWASEGQYQ